MTVEERMTIWLNDQADAYGIYDTNRQAFLDGMRDTYRGKAMQLMLTVDELADQGPLAKLVAFLFFGWRPREAARRREATSGDHS